MTTRDEEQFDREALTAKLFHPLKVAAVEALSWIGEPLSATSLTRVIDDDRYGVAHISYHLATLVDAGKLRVVPRQKTAGVKERLYFRL